MCDFFDRMVLKYNCIRIICKNNYLVTTDFNQYSIFSCLINKNKCTNNKLIQKISKCNKIKKIQMHDFR